MFLTVWLKRQEAEIFKTRIFAQGVVDLSEDGAKATSEVFKKYIASALPFMEKEQAASDKKMKEAMEKEVAKGVIVFNAPTSNPLTQRVKAMSMPDDFRAKLARKKRTV